MSAILDALRKVQRETAQRSQHPSSLPANSLAKVLTKKIRGKAFHRVVIAIALVFLVGTGVMITLGHRLFSSDDNVILPKVAEAPIADKEINSPPVPVRQREEARKPVNVLKKPDSEPQTLTKKEASLTLSSKNETTLTVTDKALQKPAPQITTRPSSPIGTSKSEAFIPDLELQAIVWSEDPESCSAMINGRLVRIGGEVGGFTVDEIGRNHVSVKSGLRSGKLRMIGAR